MPWGSLNQLEALKSIYMKFHVFISPKIRPTPLVPLLSWVTLGVQNYIGSYKNIMEYWNMLTCNVCCLHCLVYLYSFTMWLVNFKFAISLFIIIIVVVVVIIIVIIIVYCSELWLFSSQGEQGASYNQWPGVPWDTLLVIKTQAPSSESRLLLIG